MTTAGRMRLALLVLVGVVALPACAKRGEPPGGPPDTTAPFVEEIDPSGGSVRVPSDSRITIAFSEPMNKRTVETGIVVSPPCRWKKRYWEGRTYVMEPAEGLRPDFTYLVSVSKKAKDSHDVEMASTFVSGFSTGDTLDAGMISGSIRWKTMDVEGALVFLFDAGDLDSLGDFTLAEPVYITLSGLKGKYEIPFVDTHRRYSVFAVVDKNLNGKYDEDEKVGCYPGEVVFEGVPEIEDVNLTLCGETLMGSIVGGVDTASVADTLALSVAAGSVEDSSLVYGVRPDKGGRFEIGCVQPGRYVVRVFIDVNMNLKIDPGDSIVVEVPDTVRVDSCAEAPVVEIELQDAD